MSSKTSTKNYKFITCTSTLLFCSGPNYEFNKAIEVWYSGREKYDFNNPGFKPGAGNFTQLVWADSKKMGVGAAQAKRYFFGKIWKFFKVFLAVKSMSSLASNPLGTLS